MKLHTLEAECWLPERREIVFSFFSDARNLAAITPPWLGFAILTPPPIVMQRGALIDYRIRLRGLPLRWRTEITRWEPPVCFVDEQRRGPYRRWVHTHTFLEQDGGTLCRDHVAYAVLGGKLVHWLFVQRDLRAIFAYRRAAMRRRFAPPTAQTRAANVTPAPPAGGSLFVASGRPLSDSTQPTP